MNLTIGELAGRASRDYQLAIHEPDPERRNNLLGDTGGWLFTARELHFESDEEWLGWIQERGLVRADHLLPCFRIATRMQGDIAGAISALVNLLGDATGLSGCTDEEMKAAEATMGKIAEKQGELLAGFTNASCRP
ncbi:hypothetical protein [Luteolibacter sp. Populi]|uniref:hypothetical protein n=1 Tax=Luteolibacter sp. Populi TaxID=3230487 RepID=UPI003464EA9A